MSQLTEFWKELDAGRKITFGFGVLLIVALAVGIWWWVGHQRQVAVFEGLSSVEVANATKVLSEQEIDYQVSPSGDTVYVDQSALKGARAALAKSGINASSQEGFELFDNVDYGMSEFSQKIYLQRALQGEIARTIMALGEIKYARVHLVLPQSGLFRKEKHSPKAAVTLVPNRGQVLSKREVKGIQVIVASAVRGLTADRVLVTDQDGNPLSYSGESALSSNRLEQKREVEKYLTSKAQQILEQIYGPGKSMVEVDVELNYEHVERHMEKVLPVNKNGNGFVLEKRETSKRAGSVNSSGEKSRKPDGHIMETSEIKYAVGHSVEQYVLDAGGIKRLSVSVLVPAPVDQSAVDGVKKLIAGAVGLDKSRGDVIDVMGLNVPAPSPVMRKDNPSLLHKGIPDTMSGVATTGYPSPLNAVVLNKQLFVLIALVAGTFLLFLLIVVVLIRRRKSRAKLTPVQREALLLEVNGWLNGEPGTVELSP